MNDDIRAICDVMRAAQIDLYKQSLPDLARGLLSDLSMDLENFFSQFSHEAYGGDWYDVPILHELDAVQFAQAAIAHLQASRARELGKVFELLAGRQNTREKEQDWAERMKSEMRSCADGHGRIARAQLDAFLNHDWKW